MYAKAVEEQSDIELEEFQKRVMEGFSKRYNVLLSLNRTSTPQDSPLFISCVQVAAQPANFELHALSKKSKLSGCVPEALLCSSNIFDVSV